MFHELIGLICCVDGLVEWLFLLLFILFIDDELCVAEIFFSTLFSVNMGEVIWSSVYGLFTVLF